MYPGAATPTRQTPPTIHIKLNSAARDGFTPDVSVLAGLKNHVMSESNYPLLIAAGEYKSRTAGEENIESSDDVDPEAGGIKAMCFLLHLACARLLVLFQAGAATYNPGAPQPGEGVRVHSHDGTHVITLKVLHHLSVLRFTGVVLEAVDSSAPTMPRYAVKVGPAPDLLEHAHGLGANMMQWQQVVRERAAHEIPGTKTSGVPGLVLAGTLELLGSNRAAHQEGSEAWPSGQGADVVILEMAGQALVGTDGVMLVLGAAALCLLAADLLTALARLRAAGVWHNDCAPRNFLYKMRSDGRPSFTVCDLGASSCSRLDDDDYYQQLSPGGPDQAHSSRALSSGAADCVTTRSSSSSRLSKNPCRRACNLGYTIMKQPVLLNFDAMHMLRTMRRPTIWQRTSQP
ncbi:hypothetical protein WJX72_003910 [[Myrmecia] bisecta]|uniref:Protein kinase domain-containing protein n=1 Tax=[Myrmecia] bisecta TaxID=41462 RepID=A0AAW1QPV1_9CHLO